MLPLEILLHILSLLPLSCYASLYQVFPAAVVDEALRKALWIHQKNQGTPLIDLVSTNMYELSGPNTNEKNESWIPLYMTMIDMTRRLIWLQPKPHQYFFKVEDAYVSHGKLVMRRSSGTRDKQQQQQQHMLASLWDIRKQLPPARAGTFSGASEFVRYREQYQPLTIRDKKQQCLFDACLTCGAGHRMDDATCHLLTTKQLHGHDPPRPALAKGYVRRAPSSFTAWSARDPCGYVLVEQVALSVPAFIQLFTHTPLLPSHDT